MSLSAVELKQDLGLSLVEFHEEVSSTQEVARKLDAEPPYLVYARRQTTGRGRLGRSWHSEDGGLYLTLVIERFREDWSATITSTYLIHKALSCYVKNLILKWPNDLLYGKVKLAGVLAEAWGYLLGIGVGVNVNQEFLNDELEGHATSLRSICGKLFDMDELITGLVPVLVKGLCELRLKGFGYFHPFIRQLLLTSKHKVRVKYKSKMVSGFLRDLYPDGDALIQTRKGSSIRINAGQLLGGDT
ncbi:biotin--[acetyl-CoA-carboxylase] ligase [candidate division WOR-3 bacterium]|nr:biotin--[acetyl-CoA-carboxylase] ligase [candidate division WOR-3 bacterium]